MKNIDEYQMFTASTAIYPQESKQQAVAYCALGLVGEAGEVAEKIKKWIRDDVMEVKDVQKELGDVYWYLARLAEELGLRSSEVLGTNVDKLKSRQERDVLSGSGDSR